MSSPSPLGFCGTGWRLAVVCCLLGASSSTVALEPSLDRRAIEEAILIGQSRFDNERTRFHNGYRVAVSRPPVDWIDVITPFHRVALAAEGQARLGNRTFGQREARAALSNAPNLIELLIELTFHPLNTFVGVPAYDVMLSRAQDKPMRAQFINRYPRFGPRTEVTAPALPNPNAAPVLGNGQPMLGGTVIAQFAADTIDSRGRYDIVITDGAKELVRTGVDFGKMR
jgi:hypothetical protein